MWSPGGGLLQEFQYDSAVRSASFSPDGKFVLVGLEDGNAVLRKFDSLVELVSKGCDWLDDYLRYSAEATDSDRALCNIPPRNPTPDNRRATNPLQSVLHALQHTLNIG